MSEVACSCQLLPVALVGGGDGNVTRTVALPAILYHEHHLPGFTGEPPFGPAHQLFRLLFVIHAPVEKHHPGELERVVEPADVPAVGLVRYGRNVHARYVGRNAVMAEHGLVLLVMNNRMQFPVGSLLRERPQRKRFRLLRRILRPIVMQQHMPSVGGEPAARSVLMKQRQKRCSAIGHHLHESVPEEYLVQCEFAQHLPERLPVAVYAADESGEPRQPLLVAETLAGDIIGLVVHYPAMGGRTAEHLRQGIRIQVVAAPAPESASGSGTRRRPENIPRLVARREELRDIGRLSFLLFHLQSELII